MKDKKKQVSNQNKPQSKEGLITRKAAIRKAGYMAISAASMMILLNSSAEAHGSPAPPPPTQRPPSEGGGGIWKRN